MIKKILITPFFGAFPEWMDKLQAPEGYDWLLDTDLEAFKKRVKEKLSIEYPGEYGNPKIWDYRCALGLLYEEEIKDFEFWGHTDFDMVFGDVDKWFTDEQLNELDIWSNHDTYICGCWTLYRNINIVNSLFMWEQNWKDFLVHPEINGWVENRYSRLVEESRLRYKYSFFQGDPYHPPFNLKKEDGKLFQDRIEIPMLHFRRCKKWPL